MNSSEWLFCKEISSILFGSESRFGTTSESNNLTKESLIHLALILFIETTVVPHYTNAFFMLKVSDQDCEWAQKNDQSIVDSITTLERIQSDKVHSIECYIKKWWTSLLLFTDASIASLSVHEKSSNFHFAYLYFKYNILHGTHYFQSFQLFSPVFCFSFYTRHPLERYKPSVVYKTPLSYCFKVLYLLMFSYLFPADINTYGAKSNI